ncbi:MAG TPA: CHAT domain-containing protein [Tepidisphaeraceae bacterium]|jgi:hypothetical protein|nr:CHAT domain-containing protein [Tepidisphaeraceae bacterium]
MTNAETAALLMAEQVADEEGYVDLRTHSFNEGVLAQLRKVAETEKDLLWFPYTYRIQFYAKGRQRIRQLRQQEHAISAARQFSLDDGERGILILLNRKSETSGLKSISHDEVQATGLPPHVIEAAYKSLHRKGLAHFNSKALVLEPQGLAVAEGVYLLMLRERYSDTLPPRVPGEQHPLPSILSPFEKAIHPWFATLSNHWQPAPEDLTDAEEKAMYRLIGGGFIEAKVEVIMRPIGSGAPIGGLWRVTGAFPERFERQIIEFGQLRGLEEKQVHVRRKVKFLRLTSDGERAKADFRGEHEFDKPMGSTTGMPKHLFDKISGGHDGSKGCMGEIVVVRESEFSVPNEGETKAKSVAEWTILFLSADPTDAGRLRLGTEMREVENRLALGKHAKVHFVTKTAVRPEDLTQAIFDTSPQIVHFSGHGSKAGQLCLEDANGDSHLMEPDALASLFELLADSVKCVVLNACYSEAQARAIAKHIPYVVGMNQSIGDDAAIVFATGFYKAIAGGKSVPQAFAFGKVELKLRSIPEHQTPVLIEHSS